MMKKHMLPVAVALALLMVIAVAWAAQRDVPEAAKPDQASRMMGQVCSTMGTSAVAVSGDTVYVVHGDSLYRFDRNLKLLKQAQLAPERVTSHPGMMMHSGPTGTHQGMMGYGCPMTSSSAADSGEGNSEHRAQ